MGESEEQFTVDKVTDTSSEGLNEAGQVDAPKKSSAKWLILVLVIVLVLLRVGWLYWFKFRSSSLSMQQCAQTALEKAENRQALSQHTEVKSLLSEEIIDKESYNKDFLQCLREKTKK